MFKIVINFDRGQGSLPTKRHDICQCQHVGAHPQTLEVLMLFFAYGPSFLYTHQGKPRRSIWTVSFCRDWPPCTAHRRRRSTSCRRCTQLQGGHRCTLLHLRHSCGHYIHTSLGCLDWWDWNNKIDMAKLDGQKVQTPESFSKVFQILTGARLPSYEVRVLNFVSSGLLQPAVVWPSEKRSTISSLRQSLTEYSLSRHYSQRPDDTCWRSPLRRHWKFTCWCSFPQQQMDWVFNCSGWFVICTWRWCLGRANLSRLVILRRFRLQAQRSLALTCNLA